MSEFDRKKLTFHEFRLELRLDDVQITKVLSENNNNNKSVVNKIVESLGLRASKRE